MEPPPLRRIDSVANPLVKAARSLRDKKHRRGTGLFLAEGLRIATEAREQGVLPVQLFIGDHADRHPLIDALIDETRAAGGDPIVASRDVLAKLSGKDNPQSVVGIYRERWAALEQLDRTRAPIWFVAQAMRDPGNLGTLLRTGDAVGAGGVILIDDCVDPFSVETVRASMGALFTQAITHSDWDGFLGWLRRGAGQLIGTSLAPGTVDYRDAAYASPCFVLVGNEARGLPSSYEDACDMRVRIPMRGRADSLNASVAAAVTAYRVADILERTRVG